MKKNKPFSLSFMTLALLVTSALSPTFLKKDVLEVVDELNPSLKAISMPVILGNDLEDASIEEIKLDAFSNNPAVISPLAEVKTNNNSLALSFETINPQFNLKKNAKNLAVLKYDGTNLSVLNSETKISKNKLSSSITDDGIYFIADLNLFLKSLGIDVFKNKGISLPNNGEQIILDDYQTINLSAPLSSKVDTDQDGISDQDELGFAYKKDLSPLIDALLASHSLPKRAYSGPRVIPVYPYASSPVAIDTDYDGIDDGVDLSPTNNNFAGQLHYQRSNSNKTSNVEFVVDYRNFFSGNQTYSKNIAVFSSLLAADIYIDSYVTVSSGTLGGSDNPLSFGSLFGLTQMENIKIQANSYSVDKDDLTELVIGHRQVSYQGLSKEIVILSVRGTNGTNEEWSSNFDVGADSTPYYNATGSSHPDWKNKLHHKGFDVTANRIITRVNDYFSRRGLTNVNKSILITGHSRGAAIANILGSHFASISNILPYTYTFAALNTTTTANPTNQQSIFNVINTDDIIPMLPLSNWGFKKYGTTRSISVADHYENSFGPAEVGTFEWLVGSDYNNDGGTQRTISAFSALTSSRAGIYQLDTSADGKVWQNNFGHFKLSEAERELVELRAELQAEKLLKFCTTYIVKNAFLYHVEINYSPAYLMQDLANLTTGTCAHLLGHDVKGKYAEAKASFIASSGKVVIGGMEDPHLPITYYLLARNNFLAI